jgi:hypothetical protein
MMEALRSSEKSILTRATRRNIPEDGILLLVIYPPTRRDVTTGRPGDFCWSSPTQTFLVVSPAGFMIVFYCLATLGVVQL